MNLIRRLAFLSGAIGAGVFGYGWLVGSRRITVETVTIPITGLPLHLDGFTLVQLSDFHPASSHRDVIDKAIDIVNGMAADAIVLTGDYVERRGEEIFELLEPFGRLQAPVYASLGNHDMHELTFLREQIVTYGLEHAGVRVLKDTHVRLADRLVLVGINDASAKRDISLTSLDGAAADDVVIALVHRPDFADLFADDGRVALQLSGHTHGGQIMFPFLSKPLILPTYGRKYIAGKFKVGDMWLYVNRGIGTARLPLRLNCPPEITHITLRRA